MLYILAPSAAGTWGAGGEAQCREGWGAVGAEKETREVGRGVTANLHDNEKSYCNWSQLPEHGA